MWLTEASGFCCYLWKYGNINFTEKIELPSHNCSGLSSLLNKVNCEAAMRRDWHSLEWQCQPLGGDRRRSTPWSAAMELRWRWPEPAWPQQSWGASQLSHLSSRCFSLPSRGVSSQVSHDGSQPSHPPQCSLSVCLKSSNKSQHEPSPAQPGTACSLYGKFLYCWQHPPARDLQVAFKFSSRL